MAKTNQLTAEEKKARLEKRRQHCKRGQKKFMENLKFYKEVEEERFNLSLYGPVFFYFPASKEPYENVHNLTEFKRIFENQRRCADVAVDIKCLRTKQDRGTDEEGRALKIENIRIFCKQCGPKFIMRFFCGAHTNYRLQLVYFDNSHHHQKYGTNQYLKHKRKNKEIVTKIRTVHSPNYWVDLFNDVYEKSQTDKLYYLKHPKYLLLTKLRRTFTHYKYQSLEFNYLGWKYWHQPRFEQFSDREGLQPSNNPPEENPDFFMVIHPEMKKNYQLYGDVCYINIIDDGLIKKKQPYHDASRIWEMVNFTGLTQENRFGPFAFSWLEITKHCPQSIALIASKFFNLSGKKPKVIITPSDPFYDKMYQYMKATQIFTGSHFYDPVCQLQHIAQNIENPEHFTYFYNLVKSINPAQYNQNLQLLFRNVEPSLISRKLLSKFIQKSRKMCFALLETDSFVGLTFKYSGNKYMNSYYRWNFIEKWEIDIRALNDQESHYTNQYDLKEFIYMVTHQISRMFERGINYIQNRGRYEWRKYEEIVDCKQFYQIRYMVKEDIFSILLKEYGKVVELEGRPRELPNEKTPQMEIHDVYDRRLRTIFMVAPQPDYDNSFNLKKLKWRCNCLYSLKSGLPCCHEMKIAILRNTSIMDQIHEYWHNQNKNKRAAYWKPRKTRRNTEK